jgi:hypothetical protein
VVLVVISAVMLVVLAAELEAELEALVAGLIALVEAAGVAVLEEHATRVRLAAVVTATRRRRRSERRLVIVWDIVPSLQAAQASRVPSKTPAGSKWFR